MGGDVTDDVERAEGGKFVKGRSANPGGRPKGLKEVRELAMQHSAAAIRKLRAIMDNKRASYAVQIAAANALLDRAVGKPIAPTANTDLEGNTASNMVQGLPQTFREKLDIARRLAYLLHQGVIAKQELEPQGRVLEAPKEESND